MSTEGKKMSETQMDFHYFFVALLLIIVLFNGLHVGDDGIQACGKLVWVCNTLQLWCTQLDYSNSW